MTELDVLRMKRRNLQVEAKRVEEKHKAMLEDLRKMDMRINTLVNESSNPGFSTISHILK